VIRHKLALIGVFLFAASAFSVIPAGASLLPGTRHVLPGVKPDWTSTAKQSGTLAAGQRVTAKVWLSPRNAAQLDALATAVSDPASSQYGKYLTSNQYDQAFAPSAGEVSSVTQWLTGSGLQHIPGSFRFGRCHQLGLQHPARALPGQRQAGASSVAGRVGS